MHSALKLAEAPHHHSDDSRPIQHVPTSPRNHIAAKHSREEHGPPLNGTSPPLRQDTTSSVSTTVTSVTITTDETAETPYSVASSPTFAAQAIFSARDGSDVAPQRRASRRRTGPLTAVQRERAHLIRKMGACPDCRRRRVAVRTPPPLLSPTPEECKLCRLTTFTVSPKPSQHVLGGSGKEIQVPRVSHPWAGAHNWGATKSGAAEYQTSPPI